MLLDWNASRKGCNYKHNIFGFQTIIMAAPSKKKSLVLLDQ